MNFELFVRRSASKDIEQAHGWYNAQQDGLGSTFLDEVESAFKRIAGKPLGYPVFVHDVRRTLLHRFPYSVYFRVRGRQVRVLAVIHQHRDPRGVERLVRG